MSTTEGFIAAVLVFYAAILATLIAYYRLTKRRFNFQSSMEFAMSAASDRLNVNLERVAVALEAIAKRPAGAPEEVIAAAADKAGTAADAAEAIMNATA